MGEGDPANTVSQTLQIFLPLRSGQVNIRIAVQFVDYRFHDAVEQLFPAGDVMVERHALNAQVGAELAHREGTQPVLVDHGDRGAEDPSAVQPGGTGSRFGCRDDSRRRPATFGAVRIHPCCHACTAFGLQHKTDRLASALTR